MREQFRCGKPTGTLTPYPFTSLSNSDSELIFWPSFQGFNRKLMSQSVSDAGSDFGDDKSK
jgi:hypothetical protein